MSSKQIIMICCECLARNYRYKKNTFSPKRLELNKYCSICNKTTLHKESK